MDRGEMSRGQRIKRLVGDVTTCSLSRENRHISSSCHQATSCLCPTRRITCRLSGWETLQEEDEDSEKDVPVSLVGWSDRIISNRKLYFAVAHVQTIDLFSWLFETSPTFADTSVLRRITDHSVRPLPVSEVGHPNYWGKKFHQKRGLSWTMDMDIWIFNYQNIGQRNPQG